VSIPMSGGVESLNVASAAAVVAFELARRRTAG
jgi:tRNA G18 (ribose-2'-O)-methylase SpoU